MKERGMTDLDRLDALAAARRQFEVIEKAIDEGGDIYTECAIGINAVDAAARERDELRNIILNGGLRLPGFDHWRERASSKPSDPDDVRWDCSCGYSGSPEKVQKHWAALHSKDGAS